MSWPWRCIHNKSKKRKPLGNGIEQLKENKRQAHKPALLFRRIICEKVGFNRPHPVPDPVSLKSGVFFRERIHRLPRYHRHHPHRFPEFGA